jgi:hypothetical protein
MPLSTDSSSGPVRWPLFLLATKVTYKCFSQCKIFPELSSFKQDKEI